MDRPLFAGFGLRENPFSVSPDPKRLFLTRQTQKAFNDMVAGIQSRQGLILLTGDVGTGKTALLNSLVAWLQHEGIPKALIVNSHLEISELFELMLADFGVPGVDQNRSAFARLNAWLLELHRTGRTAVLIIDEAQGLPSHTLEEIRLLLNLETARGKLLQIILSGQPEFEHKLRRSELRQIQQRVGIRCKTGSLTLEETRNCIQQRLRMAGASDDSIFSPEATEAAFFYSRGIPRVINLLCEHALLRALAAEIRPVPASMIEDASRELQFDLDRPITSARAAQIVVPRTNLIPMQHVSNKPAMAFAAAVGPSGEHHPEPENIKAVALRTRDSTAHNPPEKTAAQSFSRGYVASVARKAELQGGVRIPAPAATPNFPRPNAANMRFADVGEIIADLGRSAAASAPVRINSTAIKKSPPAPAIAKRDLSEARVRAGEAISEVRATVAHAMSGVRARTAEAKSGLGANWRATVVARIRARVSWLKSYGQRLSRQCAAKGSRVHARISRASPGFARATSSLVFWLKEPLPIAPALRGNIKVRAKSEEDGRLSALNNMLWERAEPVLRWLQAPARSAQRH
jgi:general secretion pathway protein A